MEAGRCFLCLETNTVLCTDCNLMHFCTLHKQYHKIGSDGGCCCVVLDSFGEAGRGLVAARDYPRGSTIFKLKPAAIGPCVRSEVQCLNCLKLMDGRRYPSCSRCLLPVCGTQCERGSHHLGECQVLKRTKDALRKQPGGTKLYKDNIPNLIAAAMTIRLYSLKWRDPGSWNLVSMLMDHEVSDTLWELIRQAFKAVLHQDSRFEESELKRVFGIQTTNGANLQLPHGHGRGLGLYPIFALLNHSCMCNTETLESREEHYVYLKARFDIKAGEEITTCYIKPNQATFARRQFLACKWKFWCLCHRCRDPTELGAFTGDNGNRWGMSLAE